MSHGGGGGGGGLSKLGAALLVIFIISLVALLAEIFYVLWRRRTNAVSGGAGFQFSRNSLSDFNSNRIPDVEVIDIDLTKIQSMFGPPRFLFTIEEEEEIECFGSPADKAGKSIGGHCSNFSRMSLKDCFNAVADEAVVVAVETNDIAGKDATPFSTPCASPVYFTPSASPVYEAVNARSTE